ncbi:MAG: histidine kinase [Myxococcaceae bacterium]|nr:histidine kinase [Myxococcaceae bacterium]
MANDTTDLLAAGLIHEIRHPLMGIKLGLQLVQKVMGEELTSQAEWPMVLGQVKRLEELLASYQLLLSPDQDPPTRFDVGPVVAQAIDLCMLRLQPLGKQFVSQPPPEPLFGYGTPSSLLHALINVLINSLDALEQTGNTGRIWVRVLPGARGNGRVDVRVSDEGSGIEPGAAEKVFEPRFTTKRDKGSGLGLSIARRMMESVGGEVVLVDAHDPARLGWAKTELRISLGPRPAEDKPADEPAARRILLVEDDVAIRTILKRGMQGCGYHVVSAASAEEAQLMIESASFDAVVTDKNLPGKSGLDVARAVRARSDDTVLVMMTGYSSRESAKEMQRLGADAYITKPFDTAELAALIEQLILRRLARNALRDRLSRGEAPGVISRVVVVDSDPKDRVRVARLLDQRKLTPLVRPDVIAALAEAPAPHALVVDSGSLTDEAKLKIAAMQAEHPDFKVVLLSPADNTTEFLAGILLNASAQLFRPWTDEAFAEALHRSFDAPGALP